jgi:hypothetical protein
MSKLTNIGVEVVATSPANYWRRPATERRVL